MLEKRQSQRLTLQNAAIDLDSSRPEFTLSFNDVTADERARYHVNPSSVEIHFDAVNDPHQKGTTENRFTRCDLYRCSRSIYGSIDRSISFSIDR